MTYQYSRILVTGGAGFIGSHLVDRLLNENFEASILDNLNTGKLENVIRHKGRKDFNFIKGDILNSKLVNEIVEGIDAVFHLAALTSVNLSVRDPIPTNEVNVKGTLNLLKACVDSDVKRFVYASSASIYGETEAQPIRENTIPRPNSPYAVSKLASEKYVQVFHEIYGLETVCLRYFNVYGPRQTNDQYSGVITSFINRILNNQPPTIYGDGEQTRDFVNVKDVTEANILALKKKDAVGEAFNIGSGEAVTINQLAKTLLQIMQKEHLKTIHKDSRPGDVKHSCANITKATRVLEYCPKITLKKGLAELISGLSISPSTSLLK